MKEFLAALLMGLFTFCASAQNTVLVERDTVFIANEQGQKVAVTSAEIRARVGEYEARRKELAELIALTEKLAAMKERAFRLRDEQDTIANLLKEVSEAEAKILKK